MLGAARLLFCHHRQGIGPDLSLITLVGFRLLCVTDACQEAALEEVVEHLQEALRNIRSALEVLSLVEMDQQSDDDDLFKRVFAAQAMSQAAYMEAQRSSLGH